ncbi:unnamed protein product [Rotaria sordida]|uniref:Uncharacterized protein n=1 Tax=Rotaria sordida TaxID=392033 RepID=A0A815FQ83_9BILA|nr:unnamed protein product [Rotaria sordida]CAF1322237.1 unnamed protein product [Rotaria sordida]CAF1355987.1 unnamed protein product [Rotaria sordida]CAF1566681.1 unnamed protein product [Rotaria sordida]CAF3881327.1 unnamed protein product [Rotaria sordida]
MYQNEDLFRIRAKDYGDYGRLLLRKLYSKQELAECILPPGHQRYRRPPLDNDRFEYLHKAMATKFRISNLHYSQFYSKLLRPKLSDFLNDERKRPNKEASLEYAYQLSLEYSNRWSSKYSNELPLEYSNRSSSMYSNELPLEYSNLEIYAVREIYED